MKSNLVKAFAVLALVALVAPAAPAFAGEEGKVKSTFAIDGMTCGGCSAKIRLSVKDLDGVADIKVSHDDGMATVVYNAEKVSAEKIGETIEELGFKVKLEKTEKDA